MDYEKEGLLHEMFRRQAKKTPDKVAVVSHTGRSLTFKELDEATDAAAINLQHKGVEPDSIVGIYMERCVDYVICYIAILKAGGAYMPMDVSYPQTLVEDILSDARPKVVMVDPMLYSNLPETQVVIEMKKDWIDVVKKENSKHVSPPSPPLLTYDNLAYTVYSSGTTGKPKGIQCPHRGAVFSYYLRFKMFPYEENEREASNVFFTWELLRPLLRGVTLYVIPDDVIYDPALLCNYLKKHEITRILFTPSLLEAVVDAANANITESMKKMKTIIFCGEVVTVGLLDRCVKLLPHVRFLNLYSVSEAHDICYSDLTQWYKPEQMSPKTHKFTPVGNLLPSVKIVILDDDLVPQPIGMPGEIYVGGPTLARGYLNRPEMNAKRFIARPEGVPKEVGDRLYKSGDWGHMLSDGSFEICGRCDSMVKIRGYSIETQAVEAALLDLPLVSACVVTVNGKEGEDKFLVAYIVPEEKATKKEIRALLKRKLPFYMIPSYFVFLNSIPLLAASGKLDKKQLPDLDTDADSGRDIDGLPKTETEKKIESYWRSILNLKAVDVQESFFDLGGHSLLAAKLIGLIRENLAIDLTVKDVFLFPTISGMAQLIDSKFGQNSNGNGTAKPLLKDINLHDEVDLLDQDNICLDMQLRAFWRSMRHTEKWKKSRVFLTGATGFLGAFLLRDLLLHTETMVFCLVRELPDKQGSTRIRETLVQFGILAEDESKATPEQQLLEARYKTQVTALNGDVALLNMGLSDADYTYMTTEIDVIIHAAASVNLIYPYKALYGSNVLGTQNVLIFACTNKIKPLHYISTDGVFPPGLKDCAEDSEMVQYADKLTDGYSQTKWVAEQLVLKAMKRGLPVAVYRPGNMSGESKTAFWNPQDFNLLMIKGCLETECAPIIEWDVEMTPVDFVSGFVVQLIQRMSLGLGKIFHLTNPNLLKSSWLFEWITARGYTLKMMPYQDWLKKVAETGKTCPSLSPVSRMLEGLVHDESFFPQLCTYTQNNTLKALEILQLTYPMIDNELLQVYFNQLSMRKVFPRVRLNTTRNKPLTGQVAIVTGASSGIGAGVALCLSNAGAMVALAARRVEKLETLKSQITEQGGVAIVVKTDVTDRKQVTELVKHTETTLGPVNILVNNAGIMCYSYMKNLKEDQWEKQIDLNIKGAMNCIGAVLGGMIERGKGHIVNMSSDAGRRGFAGLAVYSGTKFFIEGMSQGMRVELAKTGVKVTCIQPGDVESEISKNTTDEEAREAFDGSQNNKILEPSDIGNAVVYAVTQPSYAAVNEILIEPREAPI